MKNIDNIIIAPTASIREALEILDKGAQKIVLVCDANRKLLGTISDGDVRRGILKNISFEASVEKIYCKNPTVARIDEGREEIIQKSIKGKFYQIPIVDQQGIIVGLEELENLIRKRKQPNKVVLMAGGLGTRLHPLTENLPKPMVKVGGRPILESIISSFSKYGFEDFILCLNFKSEMIKDYFGDGSSFGVNIEYFVEKERLGTAGALSQIKNKLSDSFFVMNGDVLTTVNFEHLKEFHHKGSNKATLCVRKIEYQIPYGVVAIENDVIKDITEKPNQSYFVNAGIYMLEQSVLEHVPSDTYFDMPELFRILIKKGDSVGSFPLREYWLDVGRSQDLDKANKDYVQIFEDKE